MHTKNTHTHQMGTRPRVYPKILLALSVEPMHHDSNRVAPGSSADSRYAVRCEIPIHWRGGVPVDCVSITLYAPSVDAEFEHLGLVLHDKSDAGALGCSHERVLDLAVTQTTLNSLYTANLT